MKEPFGVYIHIPFCQSKCHYCDFYSTTKRGGMSWDYVKAVGTETGRLSSLVEGRKAASIFIGGGTPSLLTPKMTASVIENCAKHLSLAGDCEITLEANPESLTDKRTKGYTLAGVNRISIGVQSLDDNSLKTLRRAHSAAKARRAVTTAMNGGFKSVSADMMFGLPDQSLSMWEDELKEVAGWGLDHLSCYQLTPEPGVLLLKKIEEGKISLPEDTLEFFDATEGLLNEKGYSHYEISNYAREGKECVHNLGYWEYRDYLGVGSSSHGMVDGMRWVNVRDPSRYISRVKASGLGKLHEEKLDEKIQWTEKLMMGLRLKRGIRFGKGEVTPEIAEMVQAGMLRLRQGRLFATSRGWRTLNSVLEQI